MKKREYDKFKFRLIRTSQYAEVIVTSTLTYSVSMLRWRCEGLASVGGRIRGGSSAGTSGGNSAE